MQCFQLPAVTSRRIDKISRDFFWKKYVNIRGLPIVSWNKICRPKQSGGLGLRKTEAVNNTLKQVDLEVVQSAMSLNRTNID